MLTNCMRLWRQAHFVSQNSNTELLEIELKCSKFARGCGPKHVWTSKVLKKPTVSEHFWEPGAIFCLATSKPSVCVCVCVLAAVWGAFTCICEVAHQAIEPKPRPSPYLQTAGMGESQAYRKGATKIQDQKKCARSLCVWSSHTAPEKITRSGC